MLGLCFESILRVQLLSKELVILLVVLLHMIGKLLGVSLFQSVNCLVILFEFFDLLFEFLHSVVEALLQVHDLRLHVLNSCLVVLLQLLLLTLQCVLVL